MNINIDSPSLPSVSGTSTISDSTTYVPNIKIEDEDEWEEETITIVRRRRVPKKTKPMDVPPWPEVQPWKPFPGTPITWKYKEPPCMFDGLPDGAYGISCPCPRHGVFC